jgi:hypothetical protein
MFLFAFVFLSLITHICIALFESELHRTVARVPRLTDLAQMRESSDCSQPSPLEKAMTVLGGVVTFRGHAAWLAARHRSAEQPHSRQSDLPAPWPQGFHSQPRQLFAGQNTLCAGNDKLVALSFERPPHQIHAFSTRNDVLHSGRCFFEVVHCGLRWLLGQQDSTTEAVCVTYTNTTAPPIPPRSFASVSYPLSANPLLELRSGQLYAR